MKIEFFQNLYERYSRLALSFSSDRPIAIKGLERRLIRTLKTVGGYGIFECYLHRSLLWQRSGDPLRRIQSFRGSSIPSWSWMAYDGGIKYMEVPFGKVTWSKNIQSPFKGRTELSGDGESTTSFLTIEAQCWDIRDSDIDGIYLDEPEGTPNAAYRCVIFGVDKDSEPKPEQMNYTLIVCKIGNGAENLYERAGVGFLERRNIVFERLSATIRIR